MNDSGTIISLLKEITDPKYKDCWSINLDGSRHNCIFLRDPNIGSNKDSTFLSVFLNTTGVIELQYGNDPSLKLRIDLYDYIYEDNHKELSHLITSIFSLALDNELKNRGYFEKFPK